MIYFLTRILQRTDTKNELFTNYFDVNNERLSIKGLEILEKLKWKLKTIFAKVTF